jgi:peptidoglycan/LPS O-acetylase OafA/YrhL
MPQLDTLRAGAVLAVMLEHYVINQRWLGFVPWARFGVQLFFVLSGFLITGILLRCRDWSATIGSGVTLRRFYVRRFLRILPLFYFVVITAAAIDIPGFRDPLFWHLTYTSNFYSALTDRWAGLSSHLWILSVEEQFYWCWPLLVLFAPERHLSMAMLAVIAAGVLFRAVGFALGLSDMALYVLPFASLDAFGTGGLLAYARDRRGSAVLRHTIDVVGLGALPLLAVTTIAVHTGPTIVWLVGLNLASALVFAALIGRAADGFGGFLGRIFEARPLLYIGKISYGLYHFLVMDLPAGILSAIPFVPEKISALVTMSGATIVAASLTWFGFERPLNYLKRYFPYDRVDYRADSASAPHAGR